MALAKEIWVMEECRISNDVELKDGWGIDGLLLCKMSVMIRRLSTTAAEIRQHHHIPFSLPFTTTRDFSGCWRSQS